MNNQVPLLISFIRLLNLTLLRKLRTKEKTTNKYGYKREAYWSRKLSWRKRNK